MPPRNLSSCIAAAIFRDTRGASLSDRDRFNFFPATPLVSVTHILEGALFLTDASGDLDETIKSEPLPSLFITPPQDRPIVSWSSGEVCAVTVGFFPDAWLKLGSDLNENAISKTVAEAFEAFGARSRPTDDWPRFCGILQPIWQAKRRADGLADWLGSDRLSDWSRFLLGRIAVMTKGQSARTMERRLRHWTGRTRQHLDHHVAVEDLHRRSIETPEMSMAVLAAEAGFSDQAHMGRAVRRTTGFSPVKLNKLIQTEEAFWCYRLLGERFLEYQIFESNH